VSWRWAEELAGEDWMFRGESSMQHPLRPGTGHTAIIYGVRGLPVIEGGEARGYLHTR
jgi:hypothetical protein